MPSFDAFASYSTSDREEVLSVCSALKQHAPELRIWMDREQMGAGERLSTTLYHCIENSSHMLFFVGVNELSEYQLDEINVGRARHHATGGLFRTVPVFLKGVTPRGWLQSLSGIRVGVDDAQLPRLARLLVSRGAEADQLGYRTPLHRFSRLLLAPRITESEFISLVQSLQNAVASHNFLVSSFTIVASDDRAFASGRSRTFKYRSEDLFGRLREHCAMRHSCLVTAIHLFDPAGPSEVEIFFSRSGAGEFATWMNCNINLLPESAAIAATVLDSRFGGFDANKVALWMHSTLPKVLDAIRLMGFIASLVGGLEIVLAHGERGWLLPAGFATLSLAAYLARMAARTEARADGLFLTIDKGSPRGAPNHSQRIA